MKDVNVQKIRDKRNDGSTNWVLTEKGERMPIGTISNGYKKVAEGKWQKVSKYGMTKKEHEEKAKWNSEQAQGHKHSKSDAHKGKFEDFDEDAKKHSKAAKELDDNIYSDEDVFSPEELLAQKKNEQGLKDLADYSKQEQALGKKPSNSSELGKTKSGILEKGERILNIVI